MSTRPLPENPSLENLRKRAKQLRNERGITLAAAQLAIAREHGFPSWPRMKAFIEAARPFVWNPPEPQASVEDEFLRHACVDYAGWTLARAAEARRMLAEHPEIAQANIYTAAATNDVETIERNATLVNVKGGPNHWEPLLYACYSRIAPTLDAARALLALGADPNAGFLWRGNVPPFTALTGAFGGGEAGANDPPHPQKLELARLLLDAGADPNDGQTLYNRHFGPNDDHLRILFDYGLGQDKRGPWFHRLGDRLLSPAQMLAEELWAAARKNFVARVKLLVEHGVDVNLPGFRDGRTAYESALRAGNDEIAAYLRAHGAKTSQLSDDERFAVACVGGRRDDALALLARDPSLIQRLGVHGRSELLQRAIESSHPEGIRLMAELGFDLSACHRSTPLHEAAWNGDVALVRLLLDLGADPNVRDPRFDATPLGWAAYNNQKDVVELLTPRTREAEPT